MRSIWLAVALIAAILTAPISAQAAEECIVANHYGNHVYYSGGVKYKHYGWHGYCFRYETPNTSHSHFVHYH